MSVKVFPFLVEDEKHFYDADAVAKVIDFIERFCRLSKPHGAKFKLLPWERQLVQDVFGWKSRDTGERRFVHVYCEVPRKNGKTYFVSALLLYLLMADGTKGGEVYASACTREQAGRVFKSVRQMVAQSEFLSDRLEVLPYKSEVKYANGDSVLKALSGEAYGSHGMYPSAVVCDEVHEWINPASEYLYEALTSGFGDRERPLVLHITTAGFGSQPTLARRLHEKAKVFATGKLQDETFYGVIYGAELDEDWTDPAVWRKANPSYDLVEKTLKRELQAAKDEPSKQNTFRRLYLNQWTQQQTRFIDLTKWDACCKPLNYEDCKGRDVVLGIDPSSVYDLTGLAVLAPEPDGKWSVLVRSYMPLKQIERRSKEDNIPYDTWHKDGWLTSTEGVSQGLTIDYPTVIEQVVEIANECNVVAVGYDPSSQAIHIIPQLEAMGLNCLPIYQSHKEMSPPTKELDRRLTSGEIIIQENPCLRWQAGNMEVEYRGDLIKPAKPGAKGSYGGASKYKIDGLVAAIIAIQATLLSYRPTEANEAEGVQVFFV